MYELTLENFKAIADRLPNGVVVTYAPDDDINNIQIVYSNNISAELSKMDFQPHLGKRIQDVFQQDMTDVNFAKIWLRLAQEDGKDVIYGLKFESETHPYGLFNTNFYSVGNRCVVSHYTNILYQVELEHKLRGVEASTKDLSKSIELITSLLGIK